MERKNWTVVIFILWSC